MKNNIYPCLWFDNQALEAANFYISIFKNSKIISKNQAVVIFELNGKKFMGLNGGPKYKFSEAVSLVVDCQTQEEIDFYWYNLIAKGGVESKCGWLKDKFGISWQILPIILPKLLTNPTKSSKIMELLLQMKKIDLKTLEYV